MSDLSQVTLDSDNAFGDGSAAAQPATISGDVASGFTVSPTAKVDTRTTPTGGGGAPGGDGQPGGAPSSGRPPPGGPDGTPPTR